MNNSRTAGRAVVIGAGLGGLAAAITLAARGHAVEVFEKNPQAGGKLNLREMQGFSFDLGPSILTMPHVFRGLFESCGERMEDHVRIVAVTPHWRNFFEDGTIFDLTPDTQKMDAELKKIGGADGFYDFLEYARSLMKTTEEAYFPKGLETFTEVTRAYGWLKSMIRFDSLRTMDRAVRSFVAEPHLVETLDYFIKYVGSSPYDAPALLNMIAAIQFDYGLWYVEGGMYNLARALEGLALRAGAKITYNAEVAHIEKKDGAASGIRLKDGRSFPADAVISNMEVAPATERLLGDAKEAARILDRFEPACSGLVLHLGVDIVYPQLAHHNFLYSREPRRHFESVFHRHELSLDPTIYLVAPCVTQPGLAPKGCSVIKALPHITHLAPGTSFSEADYDALRERVLAKLERMGLADLRSHIIAEDRWTPYDIQKNYFSTWGAIYGTLSHWTKNLGFKAPRRSRVLKGLYFVGGSVNPGGGMPMAAMSGILAANAIRDDRSA